MNEEWLALVEEDGRAYLLQRGSGEVRVRGLGRFNVDEAIGKVEVGDSVEANLGAECSLLMVEDLSTALSLVRLSCP